MKTQPSGPRTLSHIDDYMPDQPGDDRDGAMVDLFATTSSANYKSALETLKAIHRKVAVSSLPASALRGQRSPGLIRTARDFFADVDLGQFGVTGGELFASRLDSLTDDLLLEFPRKARRWGVARKAVNLFLRDAYYNRFLATAYHLSRAAHFYELPMDSYTAKALDDHDDEWDLPDWLGVGRLTASQNAVFQEAAVDMAFDYECERVHLDAYIWAARR